MADYTENDAPRLKWEPIDSENFKDKGDLYTDTVLWRTPIQNGWLIKSETGQIVYIPDGGHKWIL